MAVARNGDAAILSDNCELDHRGEVVGRRYKKNQHSSYCSCIKTLTRTWYSMFCRNIRVRKALPQTLAHSPQPLLSGLRCPTKVRGETSVSSRLFKGRSSRAGGRAAGGGRGTSAARSRGAGWDGSSPAGHQSVDHREVETDRVEHVQQVLCIHCQNVR